MAIGESKIQALQTQLKRRRVRYITGIIITLVTLALFYNYLSHHHELVHQLMVTSPKTILLLLFLFALWFGTLVLVLTACLRICNLKIKLGENVLLNAYSTYLNYFLPGQGGIVLRGLYLKARQGLPIYRFLLATLTYYVFYSVVSVALLLGGVRTWWQTAIGIVLVSASTYGVARLYARKRHLNYHGLNFSLENLAYLALATSLQAICQVLLYWVELNTIVHGLKIGQVMSYTGAANFALFVSLTPGAIGIRESFLFFSQRLNHITNAAIVGANVLDRTVYVIFLGIIFVILLAVRGKSIFSFRRDLAKPQNSRATLAPNVSTKVLEQVVRPNHSK